LVSALSCSALGQFVSHVDASSQTSRPTLNATGGSASADQYGTRVRVELVGSRGDRATGAPRTDTSDNLAPGDETVRVLFAGAPGDPNLCNIGSLASAEPRAAFYVWEVHARVVAVTASETTLQLDWQRIRADGGDSPAVGESRVVTLEPGEFRVLDFVRDLNPTAACSSALIQVRADPLPRPGPQPDLAYDVWLVYEGREQNRSVHRTVVAPSGQPARFQVGDLAWSLDGRLQPVTVTTPAVTLKASGTLVGTLSPDGSVAVTVRVVRSAGWGTTELRGEGQVEFRGGLGETVSLALPAPLGRAGAPTDARSAPTTTGVVETADRTTVDFERFFRGTQMSLYVRIARQGE
jgi:hypothetical protein